MQLSNDIEFLLEQRVKAAEELTGYDCMIKDWCERYGIDVSDIERFNGCMMYAEPRAYADLFRDRIRERLFKGNETKE